MSLTEVCLLTVTVVNLVRFAVCSVHALNLGKRRDPWSTWKSAKYFWNQLCPFCMICWCIILLEQPLLRNMMNRKEMQMVYKNTVLYTPHHYRAIISLHTGLILNLRKSSPHTICTKLYLTHDSSDQVKWHQSNHCCTVGNGTLFS